MGCLPNKKKNNEEAKQDNKQEQNDNKPNEDFAEYDLLLGRQLDNSLSIKAEIFVQCKNLPKLGRSLKTVIIAYRNADDYDYFQEEEDEENQNNEDIEDEQDGQRVSTMGKKKILAKNTAKKWMEMGRTEVSKDSLNPIFIKSFPMNYHFEENENRQKLKFEVYFIEDIEKEKGNKAINENMMALIGEAIVTLKEIMTSQNQELERNLENEIEKRDKMGKILIRGVQKESSSKFINFKMGIKGKKLTKFMIACKIFRKRSYNEWIPIFLTEEREHTTQKAEVKSVENNEVSKARIFFWDMVELPLDSLTNQGIMHKIGEGIDKLKFQIFEILKNDKIKIISEIELSNDEIIKGCEYPFNQNKKEKHFLLIEQVKMLDKFSLFSFLVSELEYQCFIFIDCTNSQINRNKIAVPKADCSPHRVKTKKQRNIGINHCEELIYRREDDVKKKDKEKFSKVEQLTKEMEIWKFDRNGKKIKNVKDFSDINKKEEEITLQIPITKPINEKIMNKISNKCTSFRKKKGEEIDEMQELCNTILKDQFGLDADNRCWMLGFGSNLPPDYDIMCNCFSITGDIMAPEVTGYNRVYEEYCDTITTKTQISGPSVISESMNLFLAYLKSESFTSHRQYYAVAIFIVSSPVRDLSDFLLLVNESSLFPCSIVVISVGTEVNTSQLEILNRSNTDSEKATLYTDLIGKCPDNLPSFRDHTCYINLHSILVPSTGDMDENQPHSFDPLNLVCKRLFKKINDQFISFINANKIKPFNYELVNTKSTPNFNEFRRRKKAQEYTVHKILLQEKESLLNNLQNVGYSSKDLDDIFEKKIPTFDRHYIFNVLNKRKIRNEQTEHKGKNKSSCKHK